MDTPCVPLCSCMQSTPPMSPPCGNQAINEHPFGPLHMQAMETPARCSLIGQGMMLRATPRSRLL
jgi:hypothetical protein